LNLIRKAIDETAQLLNKDKKSDVGVIIMVKMNIVDGMVGGLTVDESSKIAVAFAECGVDIIGLSGGLILENGLFMLRGNVPLSNMVSATSDLLKKFAMIIFGPLVIPHIKFNEYFFQQGGVCILKSIELWKQKQKQKPMHDVYMCIMGGIHSYDSLYSSISCDGFDSNGFHTLRDEHVCLSEEWCPETYSSHQ